MTGRKGNAWLCFAPQTPAVPAVVAVAVAVAQGLGPERLVQAGLATAAERCRRPTIWTAGVLTLLHLIQMALLLVALPCQTPGSMPR
jgi:hypothetical protein